MSNATHSASLKLWSFYGAAFVSLLCGLGIILLLYTTELSTALFVGGLFILISLLLFVSPALLNIRSEMIEEFPIAVKNLWAIMSDIETVRREHYKARQTAESLLQTVDRGRSDFEQYIARNVNVFESIREDIQLLMKEQQRLDKEMIEKRQQNGELQRQIGSWEDAAIRFLRTLEGFLSHEQLDSNHRELIEGVVLDFTRTLAPLGFSLIRPLKGEPFDDRTAECRRTELSDTLPPNTIISCEVWGFQRASGQIDKAHVVVVPAPQPVAPPEPPVIPAEQLTGVTPEQEALTIQNTAAPQHQIVASDKELVSIPSEPGSNLNQSGDANTPSDQAAPVSVESVTATQEKSGANGNRFKRIKKIFSFIPNKIRKGDTK